MSTKTLPTVGKTVGANVAISSALAWDGYSLSILLDSDSPMLVVNVAKHLITPNAIA